MRLAGWLKWMLMCATFLAVAPVSALDPARSITQYKHTRWSIEDGAPGLIFALAQGRDGYLWIGGRDGLFRFDGISFERIAPNRHATDRRAVSALLAARDGSVWVGYAAGGVGRFRGGVLRDTGVPNGEPYVMTLTQTADGAVWAQLGGVFPQFARHANGRWEDVGENWGMPHEATIGVMATRGGRLWVTTLKSVLFLRPGSRRFERIAAVPHGHAALAEDAAGRIWLTDLAGARAVTGGAPALLPYPTPPALRAVQTFFDRDGNLWGKTGRIGIFRVHAPQAGGEISTAAAAAKVDRYEQRDSLTSDSANAIMEDREGNIWIGTSLGLDRLRAANVVVEPLLTRIPTWGDVLLGGSDGNVYVGEENAVYRIAPRGQPAPVLANAGEAEAMCEGLDGTVWIVTAQRVARYQRGTVASVPRPVSRQGIIDCAVDGHRTLWLTAVEGLFRRTETGWQLYPIPDDEDNGGARPIIARRDGSLLFYLTAESLRRIDFPRVTDLVLNRRRALPDLRTIYEGSDSLLLGGRAGLARLRDHRARFLGADRFSAFNLVTGIVQTPAGETWTMGSQGISRVTTAALDRAFDNPRIPLHPEIFDFRDGLPAFNSRDGKRDAVRGGDGRLWFATTAGTVWVDPARLARNALPPPVAVAALRANGTVYHDPDHLTLPSGTSRTEVDYAALSLSIPERVEVRYRLEGADDDWIDPGMRRQAFYTNLGPGTYRFRVIAANNDGVWNRTGATLEFTIPPTFLQSNWFLLLVMLGFGALLWLAYSMRVRHLTAKVRAGLEVRLAERERIARELHDTLLQSFHGLVLRFQAVAERIPADQPLRPIIDQALERADAALVEGRDRVRELRTTSGDLATALVAVAEECAVGSAIRFNFTVEGQPRALHPMVRDEVEHIAAEAIRNAFQHACAREIEAVLIYRPGKLGFDLRDDGLGLPAGLAAGGAREGHYGLTGMRERAQRIGGTLAISSRKDSGTEVVLSIPASAAYVARRGRWWLPLFLARQLKG